MTAALLVLAWALPLALAPVSLRPKGRWLPVVAPLPALATVGLVPPGLTLSLEWLLLGVHLAFDWTGKLFLLFSALLWLFAAAYGALNKNADAFNGRFRLFFLASLAGNLLLILAADLLTFYVGFALMGLAAYGMVVTRRSQHARRAGRRFLAWTLVGELALLSALWILATNGHSLVFSELKAHAPPAAAVTLLVLGFGIKLALPGLHFWLPQTYAAAPAVAVAVLSGPMLTAGLLGWLRFLPAQAPGLSGWSDLFVAVGAIGVALGIAAGLVQRNPRIVLGYSSVMKVGLMTAAFGIALGHPTTANAILAALVLFALNHLLVKGALFLGIGEWERLGARPALVACLVLLALALAGAPLTGGAAAKAGLSATLATLPHSLDVLFSLAALGTTLLMMRLLWLVTRVGKRGVEPYGPATRSWLVLVVLALWLPFYPSLTTWQTSAVVPLMVGIVLGGLAWLLSTKRQRPTRFGAARLLVRLRPRAWREGWLSAVRQSIDQPTRLPSIARPAKPDRPMPSLAQAGSIWLWMVLLLLTALLAPG